MEPARLAMLELLRANQGFDEPEAWVDYALAHDFRPVAAVPRPCCPDCGGAPRGAPLGQFVYYSTLHRLRECSRCGLLWADVRIDPSVVQAHFEAAYKDEAYFARRGAIFADLAARIDALAPRSGSVLDVGGAVGHLLAAVRERRPDLSLTLNDRSAVAREAGRERFGLETLAGTAVELAQAGRAWDVVVLADVLYYEPDLAGFWARLPGLVAPGGALVLRIPNKLAWIRWGERLRRALRPGARRTRIAGFNPEHLYVFSRRYLFARLRGLGFARVEARPSPALAGSGAGGGAGGGWSGRSGFRAARALRALSGGRWIATPSQLVVASGAGARGIG